MLKKHIKEGNIIRLISHNDADGLTSAGVIANAIKEEGGQFHTTILSRLKAEDIEKLSKENYKLFIFSDMGSSCLSKINQLIKADVIIADHHQPSDVEPKDNLIHVNPHLFGIDGSKELSGAGASYLVVRDLDKKHLAYIALIGAFGDMQCYNGFVGINKLILDDALEAGNLEIHDDLKIVSKSNEPLYKSLAYTLNPPLPGITGNLEKSQEFLDNKGISYGIKFTDLGDEEKDFLKDELIKLNPNIWGDVYSVPKENPVLRNLEEYSILLDSCGKNKKFGLGISILLGERDKALDAALNIQKSYRNDLMKGMEWIINEGSNNLDNIQYVYSEDKVLKAVMGIIISVGMSANILPDDKPILSLAKLNDIIKISGRTTRPMVERGVNLGKALNEASVNFGGQGGGHDIAAGAVIPVSAKDNFLNLVNDIIGHQINDN